MRAKISGFRSVLPRWRVWEAVLVGLWLGWLLRSLHVRPFWVAALYATGVYLIGQLVLSKGAKNGGRR